MTNSSWRSTAELIGIAAIVASLIFVGLQLKQSQDIAIAAQYQARAESVLDLHTTYMETGVSRLSLDLSSIGEMSAKEESFALSALLWSWINLDNNHYQFQAGFMSEESWAGYESQIQSLHTSCEVRWIYETYRRNVARASFNAFLDSIDDPCSPADHSPPQELVDRFTKPARD